VIVVVNLSHSAHTNYQLGFPSAGLWRLRLNSDWTGYSVAFGGQACSDVDIPIVRNGEVPEPIISQRDGFPVQGTINIGPYSVLIFSRDK
jgi:1,4-alpha-glucan branching enzyme